MHTNDVQLVRVFTRRVGSPISDQTFPSTAPFEVVVEAEAGATIHGTGDPYEIRIVVKDLSDNSFPLPFGAPGSIIAGNFGVAPWAAFDLETAFPALGAQGAAKEHHVYVVIASLTASPPDPNVSFAVSPLFIITPP